MPSVDGALPSPASVEGLRALSGGLVVVYAVLVPLHLIQLDGSARAVMVSVDLLLTGLFLAQRLALSRGDRSVTLIRVFAAGDIAVTFASVVLLFSFDPDPFYTHFVLLILVACGAFLLSAWWLGVSIVVVATTWVAILQAAGVDGDRMQLIAVLVTAAAVAAALFAYRLQNLRTIRAAHFRASQELGQRRLTEKDLRTSENRLELAITSSGGGWWDVELDPSRPGKMPDDIYLSPALKALLGFREDELPNSLAAWRDRMLPEDRDRVAHSAQQHLEGHQPEHSAEYRIRHSSGEILWMETLGRISCDEAGRPIRFSGVDRDITERISRSRTLDVLSRAVEQSSSIVLITDPEGDIRYVNPRFTQVTGYEAQEVLGSNPRLLKSGDTPPEVYADLWATITAGENWQGELKNQTKSGKPYWVLASISQVTDDQGRVINFLGVQEDITERKLIEERLLKSQRLEAVGRLVSGVAHDFNNLLTSILGFGEMAVAELPQGAGRCQAHLKQVLGAGESAATLIRQLLAVGRQQILRPRLLDLGAELAKNVELLQRVLGEDIEVVTDFDPEAGLVKVDSTQLQQILLNLAVNGRDAMPQGGLLTFETANVDLDESYVSNHPGAKAGSFVMLAISDTGIGMDEETIAQVFEPFFTTKKLGQGTGLGLATTYGIVKQSGGYIWAYSEPDKGSTFKIYLPRHTGDAEAGPPELPVAETSGTETILLVEDAAQVRRLLADFLAEDGYTVLEADDSPAAQRIAAAHDGSLDLLITDLVLPSDNGLHLAEELKRRYGSLKVLLITGYAEKALRRRHGLDPSLPLLNKPFNMQDFAVMVRRVLDGDAPGKEARPAVKP